MHTFLLDKIDNFYMFGIGKQTNFRKHVFGNIKLNNYILNLDSYHSR